jgi:hypothetical protein
MNRLFKYGLIVTLVLTLAACDEAPTGKSSKQGAGGSPTDAGLVARWTFDEGKGETAADASGNGNTAKLRNAGWGDGKLGTALQMNGGNDSIVTIPLSDSLRSTAKEITVMGWAYRRAAHNVDIVGHGYPSLFLGFHGHQFKWLLENTSNKKARCYADPKYYAALDRWYHLAGTYDGRTARLYVDGKQICRQWLWRSGPVKMPDVPFTISGYLDPEGEIVDEITGRVDDVRIYNRVLSADEIMGIYTSAN